MSNTARPTAADLEETKGQEDQLADRVDLLMLDVELLRQEVHARSNRIDETNNALVQLRLSRNGGDDQEQIENLQTKLQDYRKEYLAKKKEFAQKNSELQELQPKLAQQQNKRWSAEREAKRGTVIAKRQSRTETPVRIEPAASAASGISPVLEKRLSAIEAKLDNVLRALNDLKRENRQ